MAGEHTVHRVRAVVDPELDAILGELTPLTYSERPAEVEDVPPHVRAASAVRHTRGRLIIVQDDVNALVLHDPATDQTRALVLPASPGGRRTFGEETGNKRAKMDLEACAVLPDGRLVAFGSGSTDARERLVVFGDAREPRVVDGRDLYARLRAEEAFAGSELNVEGALVVGDALMLFQRGNGARVGEREPVNATCILPVSELMGWLDGTAAVPSPRGVVQYDLGSVGGVPFTFTDAARMDDGRVAFLACAEDSPDTYRDGEVLGCRFGIMEGDAVHMTDIRRADGRQLALKLEGLEARPGFPWLFDVVVDMDRPNEPALLGTLEVQSARR